MATTRNALSDADIRILVKGRSDQERALVAHRLCHRMDRAPLTDAEHERAQDILRILASDATAVVRRALAVTLKSSPLVPRDVALRLARDIDSVCEPILNFSPAFTDDDLIEIVRIGDPIRQGAIASRPFVSEQVSDAIIELGEAPAVSALVSNDNAVLPSELLQKVIDRFEQTERVLEAVALRRELPLDVTERLVDLVSDQVREHLVAHHALTPETALRLAASAAERASIDLVDQAGRNADLGRFVQHLNRAGRLTSSLLLRALAHGHMAFFEHGLAELGGVPHHRTWLMVHDAGHLGLKAIYERAGLPARLFPAFRVGVDTYHALEHEGAEADHFQALMLERFLTQSHPTAAEDLDYLLERLDMVRREPPPAERARLALV